MEEAKKCIYHIPYYLNPEANSGSCVRPRKMLQAFKNIGYDVDVIMGYGKERKNKIKEIKKKIKMGTKYEFMYSESSTMPTLLTEKHHMPTHPFLDFGFMKFCKKRNIKIALYYRDIYWKFPFYGHDINKIKRNFAILMYKYDIKRYSKLLDILYLQTMKMAEHLPKYIGDIKIKTLPPGCEINNVIIENKKQYFKKEKNDINIFYVGGIEGNLYDIEPLLKMASEKEYVTITICCRKKEWERQKEKYGKYLNSRINIVHESGKELEKHYANADICSIYLPEEECRKFMLPIKLFEYMSNVTPIIATKRTETGKFVEKYDIGWSIECNENEISKLIETINKNRELINNKHENLLKIIEKNTWEERAKQVEKEIRMEQ